MDPLFFHCCLLSLSRTSSVCLIVADKGLPREDSTAVDSSSCDSHALEIGRSAWQISGPPQRFGNCVSSRKNYRRLFLPLQHHYYMSNAPFLFSKTPDNWRSCQNSLSSSLTLKQLLLVDFLINELSHQSLSLQSTFSSINFLINQLSQQSTFSSINFIHL